MPSGMTYGLCLHTGLMRPMAQFQGDGKRSHEWPVFKKHWRKWVYPEKRRYLPVVVVDPAYIDQQYWFMQKREKLAVFISREKENMKPTVMGFFPYDPADPVNLGVIADNCAGYSNVIMRRIEYQDPITKERFVFTTTDNTLRPGVVALLYLMRWKIEKCFDVFKNKVHAQKAWANGPVAAMQQAHFMALLHNLLTVLLHDLEAAGIHEEKIERRHIKAPDPVPSHRMIRHARVMTCQFIRLVRNLLPREMPWDEALPLFKQRLLCYL
ncbi:MAG: transposase [Opitutaceae bacterium]